MSAHLLSCVCLCVGFITVHICVCECVHASMLFICVCLCVCMCACVSCSTHTCPMQQDEWLSHHLWRCSAPLHALCVNVGVCMGVHVFARVRIHTSMFFICVCALPCSRRSGLAVLLAVMHLSARCSPTTTTSTSQGNGTTRRAPRVATALCVRKHKVRCLRVCF